MLSGLEGTRRFSTVPERRGGGGRALSPEGRRQAPALPRPLSVHSALGPHTRTGRRQRLGLSMSLGVQVVLRWPGSKTRAGGSTRGL